MSRQISRRRFAQAMGGICAVAAAGVFTGFQVAPFNSSAADKSSSDDEVEFVVVNGWVLLASDLTA